MVRRGAIDLPQAQGHVRGAEGPHGVGDREDEPCLDMLKFKCWYYEQAIQDGSEDRLEALIPDNLPEEIKGAYENAHAR